MDVADVTVAPLVALAQKGVHDGEESVPDSGNASVNVSVSGSRNQSPVDVQEPAVLKEDRLPLDVKEDRLTPVEAAEYENVPDTGPTPVSSAPPPVSSSTQGVEHPAHSDEIWQLGSGSHPGACERTPLLASSENRRPIRIWWPFCYAEYQRFAVFEGEGLCCIIGRRVTNRKLCIPFLLTYLLLVAGFIIYCTVGLPAFRKSLNNQLTLTPNGSEGWVNPKGPILLSVYMFNISNTQKVLSHSETIRLTELGPYVYRVVSQKVNVTWNSNDTVSYRVKNTFVFDHELSNGQETDLITTADVPLFAILKSMEARSRIMESLFRAVDNQVFITKTVQELLWGYQPASFEEYNRFLQIDALGLFPQTKAPSLFGYLLGRNNTAGYMINEYIGKNNIEDLAKIHSWNFKSNLSFWLSDKANAINGTDGSRFSPVSGSNKAYFSTSLFRSFNLDLAGESSYEGVKTQRFEVPDRDFLNSTLATYPDPQDNSTGNSTDESESHKGNGFCVPKCVPNGAYTIHPALNGAPIYVSLPHFLGADSYYRKQVKGMKPNHWRHRPVFDIDEISGISLSFRLRHQLNAHVGGTISSQFPKLTGSGTHFVPILWLEVSSQIDESTLEKIKAAEFFNSLLNVYIFWCYVGVLCVITPLVLIKLCCGLYFIIKLQRSDGIP